MARATPTHPGRCLVLSRQPHARSDHPARWQGQPRPTRRDPLKSRTSLKRADPRPPVPHHGHESSHHHHRGLCGRPDGGARGGSAEVCRRGGLDGAGTAARRRRGNRLGAVSRPPAATESLRPLDHDLARWLDRSQAGDRAARRDGQIRRGRPCDRRPHVAQRAAAPGGDGRARMAACKPAPCSTCAC